MNEDLRRLLHQKLHETVRHVGEGLGVEAEVEIRQGYPVLYNDPDITRHAAIACSEYLGRENVIDSEPLMTAEDFAYYLQEKPGTFWQIGTGLAEQDRSNMLHSPTFDPDENALSTGAGLLAYSAIRFMDYFAGEKD
jgi:amidohydrolase/hippurate hydrolase